MAGGATAAGGSEAGDVVAQALPSIGSSSSICTRAVKLVFGFIGDFLHRGGAALFFGPGILFGLAGGPLQL
jgi:hypothetical protein